ncbi:MAG TPA: YCF48-related protein, partial [Candidatus Kapabacteria bacterium]|nr:YCF48-related protein [Candidatus Kapabacteria bacterium]
DSGNTWSVTGCLFSVGPFSGCYFINTISVSPYNDSVVVAGSTDGNVSRTTNFGKTWTNISAGLPQRYISSVHVAKDNSMYATASGFGSGHVFWYPDTAKKWYDISGKLPDAPANDVFATGDTLVVGTLVGTFISTNNGASWAAYGTGMPAVSVEQLLFNPQTQTLRAVTHGRSMFDITFGSPSQHAPQFLSLPDTTPVDPGQHYVYAPVVSAYPPPVYTVASVSHTATVDSTLGIVQWLGQETGDTITLTAHNTAGTATQKFYLPANVAVPATDWHVVSSEQTGRKTYALFSGGGKTLWMTQDSGIAARSNDGGATWTRSVFAADTLGPVTGLYAFDSLTAFAGTWQGNIYETTNGGSSWQISRSDPNTRYENIFFTDRQHGMAISAGEKDTAFVVVTTNGGTTWSPQPSHAFSYLPLPGTLYFFDHSHGWFASSNQLASPPGTATIFYTKDGGITWTPVTSQCNYVSSIAFLDTLNGFAVDRYGGVVDKTTDGGQSWTSVAIPPAGHDLCSVKTFPPTSIVWMVSSANAWVSYDKGNKWTTTTLVPIGPVSAAVFADTNLGWAAGQNNIVQQHNLNPVVFVQEGATPPNSFTLENYPNPFSHSTNLQFSLDWPFAENVSLKIYNEVGACVKDLTPSIERNTNGKISVAFDAEGLPEGIYFAVLQSGAISQMKALVHVR